MAHTKLMTMLLGGVSALSLFDPAAAQPAANAAVTETVVVTGSRLIANGNDMPTPVTVVSAENLASLKPTNIIDAINELPVFSGGRTQVLNGTPTGGTGGGAASSNQLSLRDLGSLRTLVLFDGQRVAPTSITNIVDADIIPQMLIQRVDVVTGGASAVYGSDAVTGVVNFIPDKSFDGVKARFQAGETTYGDNRNWKAGIAAGTSLLGGRAHIEGSLEHYDDAGVPSPSARPWYNARLSMTGAGTAASPFTLLPSVRSNQNTFGGLITTGGPVLTGQTFDSNGVLTPFVHGQGPALFPTLSSTQEIGGEGVRNDSQLVAASRWTQFYGRGDFDFTENFHGHVQAGVKHGFNAQRVGWFASNNFTYSATNAFLPAVYQTQLAAAKLTTFRMSELVNKVGPWEADVFSNQAIVNAGLDGDIAGYRWNLGFNYGLSLLTDFIKNDQNNEHLSAALDAVSSGGQIVCNVTVTNPGVHPGCVPLNLFGPTAASADALSYVYQTIRWDGKTKMYDANASVSGQPFATWAGPVAVALSAEWRRTTFSSFTNDPSDKLANCTGIRFNCPAGQVLWQNAFGIRSEVGIGVTEGAVEFDVPLLKDVPMAQSFSVNGAARFMSYSSSGDFTAWKIGAVWEVNDELRLRGTASRDIRAPTINDLFAPPQVMPTTALDLLTNTSPTVLQYRQGNLELKPEIGRTNTGGVVYKPDWLPGASFTVDAFDIVVSKAIIEIRGVGNSPQLACYASGGASTFCQLQTRPLGFTNTTSANAVTSWGQKFINIGSLRTYGTDIEANYVGEIFGHHFGLRGYVTWQPHILNVTPGLPDTELAGTAQAANPNIPAPSLRVTVTESFNITDQFRVDLTERGRNALRLNGDRSLVTACCEVPAIAYINVNMSYALTDMTVGGYTLGQSEVFFNASNLLDVDPPSGPTLGIDDAIGRSFVLGVRLQF